MYFVGTGHDQGEVGVVVDEEHEDADQPLISEVAEDHQEDWESVVEGVLEKIALGPDEDVPEETAEVLSELGNVKHLHLEGDVGDRG